eukprot:1397906-Prymnesium_polylepis.1
MPCATSQAAAGWSPHRAGVQSGNPGVGVLAVRAIAQRLVKRRILGGRTQLGSDGSRLRDSTASVGSG